MDDDYNNARALDMHRWSNASEVEALTDEVSIGVEVVLCSQGCQRLHRDKLQKTLKVVLLNLFHNYVQDTKRFLFYPRNRNNFQIATRYNKLRIKCDYLIKVIDSLETMYLINQHPGFYDWKTGQGRRSRMIHTVRLVDLFKEYALRPETVHRHPDTEVILLKDRYKELTNYTDTKLTVALRRELQQYNRLLSSSRLTLANKLLPPQYLYRVFSNGSWELGGRFYGGEWEQWKSKQRCQIKINGSKVCERDYPSLHLSMLYDKRGIKFEGDPYTLDGYSVEHRKLFKQVNLATINASSRGKARKAIQWEINQGNLEMPKGETIDGLIEAFLDKHKAISEFFFTGVGLELQRMDSRLTEYVLNHFTSQGILCLPVHDSYLVDERYSSELKIVMDEAYSSRIVLID